MKYNPKLRRATGTTKAYNNNTFLNSREARNIRIQCELTEPAVRLKRLGIDHLISFFGSARTDKEDKYYQDTVTIAHDLTKWCIDNMPNCAISSGGGPGIMEATNKGAWRGGGHSIGMGISLPFEQRNNRYISQDLNFEYHYFFTRKYWCVYLAKAFIAMPGGFGTLDELFEVLTLIQTKKLTIPVPIVLYDSEYWNSIVNFDKLVEHGTISANDLNLFKIYNRPSDVVKYITSQLTENHLKDEE